MPKLPECDRCLFCAHDYNLVCAIHPIGVEGDSCLDFRPDPELKHLPFRDFLGVRLQPGDETCTNENPQMGTNGSQIMRRLRSEPSSASQQRNNEPYTNPHDLEPGEQLWEPVGASYYNGEFILQPQQLWTREEQLELLDWHPLFTGKCPQCSTVIERDDTARVHWDCSNPECGWKDDTV